MTLPSAGQNRGEGTNITAQHSTASSEVQVHGRLLYSTRHRRVLYAMFERLCNRELLATGSLLELLLHEDALIVSTKGCS